ncbi:MAG: GNAT family N-acetyltransferase [Candidatus Cloacimonetes bacterium]|nr:GNAT family N-acetyltransferase [Candidatus Cloacimonadota bacterium]
MEKISYRLYRDSDYQALIEFWQEAGLHIRPVGRDSRQSLAIQASQPMMHLLLAVEDQEISGTVIVTHDGRKGWINRLATAPRLRRTGLAKELIRQAEAWLRQQGIHIYTCLIEDWNTSSRALFLGMDYVEHRDIIYYSKRENNNV